MSRHRPCRNRRKKTLRSSGSSPENPPQRTVAGSDPVPLDATSRFGVPWFMVHDEARAPFSRSLKSMNPGLGGPGFMNLHRRAAARRRPGGYQNL